MQIDTSLCSSYPRDTLVDIDFAYATSESSIYLLYKNGNLVAVQAPPTSYLSPEDTLLHFYEDRQERDLRTVLRLAEEQAVDFSRVTWMDLYHDGAGNNCRLVPRSMHGATYKITSPTWLPFVQESDIQLIKWVQWGRSLCLLRGQRVVVDIGWDDKSLLWLDDTMKNLKTLAELDLCYQPLAHVLRGKDVVGLVYEDFDGRHTRYTDKRTVYEAYAKAFRNRIYFTFMSGFTHIDKEGRFRLIDNFHVVKVFRGPIEENETSLREKHMRILKKGFEEFREKPTDLEVHLGSPHESLLTRYYQSTSEHPHDNPALPFCIPLPRFSSLTRWFSTYIPRRQDELIRVKRRRHLSSSAALVKRGSKGPSSGPTDASDEPLEMMSEFTPLLVSRCIREVETEGEATIVELGY
ncbi:hypothetical protein V5O48_007916 [Marasmius crinis-equi]|uniref:Uncharacterized protein n=1 Tax=Marasmius crinis-equi TaxID=585013 RepID=A0ABR3FFC1_9AGAR